LFINPFNKPTEMDKELLGSIIELGDNAIDATCGNGHDTSFLAERVGSTGKVYGFDIQNKAIKNTHQLLEKKGLIDRVELIRDSHESMKEYVSTQVKCVMFNLGYLPGSDKMVVTKSESSISGIESALDLLIPGGIVTIVVYPGHETGQIETRSVDEYIATLDQDEYSVRKIDPVNYRNCPPQLIVIQKK